MLECVWNSSHVPRVTPTVHLNRLTKDPQVPLEFNIFKLLPLLRCNVAALGGLDGTIRCNRNQKWGRPRSRESCRGGRGLGSRPRSCPHCAETKSWPGFKNGNKANPWFGKRIFLDDFIILRSEVPYLVVIYYRSKFSVPTCWNVLVTSKLLLDFLPLDVFRPLVGGGWEQWRASCCLGQRSPEATGVTSTSGHHCPPCTTTTTTTHVPQTWNTPPPPPCTTIYMKHKRLRCPVVTIFSVTSWVDRASAPLVWWQTVRWEITFTLQDITIFYEAWNAPSHRLPRTFLELGNSMGCFRGFIRLREIHWVRCLSCVQHLYLGWV